MSDIMVLKTQQWLNTTYGGMTGYTIIPENGITGWTTIYALLHALQIELGITATADNFGPSTITRFNNRFPNGIQEQNYPSSYEDNIYGIIQGALWCKGYSTGASSITKHFYGGTGGAVEELKYDAGCIDTSSTVTLNVIKALMSMTQFKLVNGGNTSIRQAQREMNNGYEAYIGLSPCDGVYGREMNKSMIKVLQAIEGYSVEDATGNFGAGTKANLPIVPSAGQISDETEKKAIKLVRYSLVCNGYNVGVNSNQWDTLLSDAIEEFQGDLCLQETRICDTDTWMSLLLSRGNPERNCIACDTVYDMLVDSRRNFLANNGYSIVGRYINGTPAIKEFEPGETKKIVDEGFSYFPIYQRNGQPSIENFTTAKAIEDALEASKGVLRNGVPKGNIVYFAVDLDVQEDDITNVIIPYFSTLSANFDPEYSIGVYGTRNVCEKVMNNNSNVVTCFVSDMSTGYSGNMGFKMPSNWNLDQFYELSHNEPISSRINVNYPTNFDIDRVAYSGNYPVVNTYDTVYVRPANTNITNQDTIAWFNEECIEMIENYAYDYIVNVKQESVTSIKIAGLVLDALRYFKYNDSKWQIILGSIDTSFMQYFTNRYTNEYHKIFSLEFGDYLSSNDDDYLLIKSTTDSTVIDVAHLAATTLGYLKNLAPHFWTGWGGDLATAMARVKARINSGDTATEQDIANEIIGLGTTDTIGSKSPFNYSDFCSDADAIEISNIISLSTSMNPVSDALTQYYQSSYANRHLNYITDIGATSNSRGEYYLKIKNMMENVGIPGILNVITFLGDDPSQAIIDACCVAFANYIFSLL